METCLCPVCNSFQTSLFIAELPDNTFKTTQETFNLYRCNNCEATFQYPFIDEKKVGKYYPNSSYHPFTLQANLISSRLKYNPPSIYIRELQSKHHPNDSFSLIDLGCGGGTFLMSVKHYFPNSKLTGVDLFEPAIKTLADNGIEGVCSSVYDYNTDKKFDYIVSSQVLEHLNRPYSFVEKVKELSGKGSLIMIDVPASDSYSAKKFGKNWVHWDMPRHSILYGEKTLRYLFSSFTTLELKYAGNVRAIMSSYKLSKGKDIFQLSSLEHLLLAVMRITGKVLHFSFLFSDKLVWIGKLK